jgi:hypothetical protein
MRSVKTQGRKIDSLARRPAPTPPVAAGGGTRPWIVLENLGQTLPSGGFKHSLFTDAWYDPVLVTLDNIFTLTSRTEDAANYWELTTRIEGWYTAEYVHLWSNLSTLTTTPAYAAQQITFNTTGIHFFHDRHIGDSAIWTNDADMLDGHAYIHTYRTVYLPAVKAWPAFVRQSTGDNRDCSGHLKVWYEGVFGSTGGDNSTWTDAAV